MKHLTKTTLKVSLRPVTEILALSFLAAALCVGQLSAAEQPAVTDQNVEGWVVDKPGKVLELESVVHSALTVSGAGSHVVVNPGLHTVHGDVKLDASGSRMIVGFDRNKVGGRMDVKGNLILGPENSPELSLDLKDARFVKGDKFVICSADNIVGEFNGLGNDSKFEKGNVTLLIHYGGEEITLTVTDVSKHNYPSVTPVVELNADLVHPTSTGPVS